jgi:ribosomal protein S18 acetylase RimI-like enzyme
MTKTVLIHEAGLAEIEARAIELATLLREAVNDGASLGFLAPLSEDDALSYWTGVSEALHRIVLVAEIGRRIVGTVQLDLCDRANGNHRAEVMKLVVHPSVRRQGIGRALMAAAEQAATEQNRSLLVLDTRAGDPSEALYRSMQYQAAGVIPRFARSSTDLQLHDTVIFYKEINPGTAS